MTLGIRLHELSRLKLWVLVGFVIAVTVAASRSYNIGLLPPALHPKAVAMAAASTYVLVDNPHSALLDPNEGTDQLTQMTNRALLLGNIMASLPVRQYIARRAGVPAGVIEVSAPVTPQYPRAIVGDPRDQRRVGDLFRSNNQYRLNIKVNPTVPIIDVYTEASEAKTAVTLANAAVEGLRDYLAAVGAGENVAAAQHVRLEQLGGAEGGSVSGGVNFEVALLWFLFVFTLGCGASLVLSRVLRGWRLSREVERLSDMSAESGPESHHTAAELEREYV